MKYIIILIWSFFSSATFAGTGCGYSFDVNNRSNTLVYFINGINNSVADACASSDALAATVASRNIDYKYFYNPGNGKISDVLELKAMAAFSDTALKQLNITSPSNMSDSRKLEYYRLLGSYYSSLSDTIDPVLARIYVTASRLKDTLILNSGNYKRVILVPHSQGNAYVEIAYGMLLYENKSSVLSNVKVVGVASVAPTTPDNVYISNNIDGNVYGTNLVNTLGVSIYHPLPSEDSLLYITNETLVPFAAIELATLSYKTNLFHSFVDVYLSDFFVSVEKNNKSFRQIVHGYIRNLILPNIDPYGRVLIQGLPIVGQLLHLQLRGTELPTVGSLDVTLKGVGCDNLQFVPGLMDKTLVQEFTCTPNAPGLMDIIIKDSVGGTILQSYQVTVQPAALLVCKPPQILNGDACVLPLSVTCTPPQVLTSGVCVSPTVPVVCTPPQVLTSGVCVPLTVPVVCTPPQVLTSGACISPIIPVVCTLPKVLTSGVCVLPTSPVVCTPPEVFAFGFCLPPPRHVDCTPPQVFTTSGCVSPVVLVVCTPPQVLTSGVCVSPIIPVVCIPPQVLTTGVCGPPPSIGGTTATFTEDFNTANADGTIGGVNSGVWSRRTHSEGVCVSPTSSVNNIVLSGGLITLGNCNDIDTAGKKTFSAGKYVIESRFAGTGSNRNTYVGLVDAADPTTVIYIGDTNYSATAVPGVYVYATGVYARDFRGLMASTAAFKAYRITIEGSEVTVQRGDSLSNLTETQTVTLNSSTAGKTFYLSVGTARNPYFPGVFDWVSVATVN